MLKFFKRFFKKENALPTVPALLIGSKWFVKDPTGEYFYIVEIKAGIPTKYYFNYGILLWYQIKQFIWVKEIKN